MSTQKTKRISVQIHRGEHGHIVATSDDFPGLFIERPTVPEVMDLIAQAVELLYRARFSRDVTARVCIHTHPHARTASAATRLPFFVPVEIIARVA